MNLQISPLTHSQLDSADRIFRLAFGTRNGLPDPMKFDGDAARIKARFFSENVLSLAATINGELVGTSFGTIWGSFAWLGPLSVDPQYWNKHIAQELLEIAIPALDQPVKRHQALFTVADSAKHLALYRKFGFSPWFLTAVMEKPIQCPQRQDYVEFSHIPNGEKNGCLNDMLAITNTLYTGMDLAQEVRAVASRGLGDTIIVMESGTPVGFAICHYGPGTEATSDTAYVKFAAVHGGAPGAKVFDRLLDACERSASLKGMLRITAGINTGRRMAYGAMLNRGFRTIQQGVAMHRPDEPAYDRPDIYAIDDWR